MPKFSDLPASVQSVAIAAAAAVVPLLPALLDTPPGVTLRDVVRAGLSAACATFALWLHKPGAAPKADA